MSPRDQRIAETLAARDRLNDRLRELGYAEAREISDPEPPEPIRPPAVFAPPSPARPVKFDAWQDVAHANMIALERILSTGVRHVCHELATARKEAV
ncbi:hypothetical protein LQF12_02270 [Ruania suaedae]|uniref:hypothetical protein n=1 Tax=Ruania suaedae TaxID=2897774 RepID=UPI001E390C73|nr:hypothetical protein [Ruania suaedae]UFU03458.1 hypothetical protein LQF12_02270 [Ruania suaedae]